MPSRVSLVAGSLRACSVPLVVCLLPSLRSISYTQKSYSTRSNATGVCVYLTGSFFAPANNLYTCGVPCSPVQSIQPTQRETHFTQQATGEWNGHSIEYRLCDCLSADLRLSVLPYPTSSLKRTSSQSLDVICFFPVIVLLLPEMCVVCVCVCVWNFSFFKTVFFCRVRFHLTGTLPAPTGASRPGTEVERSDIISLASPVALTNARANDLDA